MREFIYYPGFQIKDHEWLKFALIYLDTLDPIIPDVGDQHLEDWYKRIQMTPTS